MKKWQLALLLTTVGQLSLLGNPTTAAFQRLIKEATCAEVVYCNTETLPAGISHIRARFIDDDLVTIKSKIELNTITIKYPGSSSPEVAPNCRCLGDHYLIFWKYGAILQVFTYHHGHHIRSAQLNNGSDAFLSESSRAWLNQKINLQEIVDLRKSNTNRQQNNTKAKTAEQDDEATPTPAAEPASAPVMPAAEQPSRQE